MGEALGNEDIFLFQENLSSRKILQLLLYTTVGPMSMFKPFGQMQPEIAVKGAQEEGKGRENCSSHRSPWQGWMAVRECCCLKLGGITSSLFAFSSLSI